MKPVSSALLLLLLIIGYSSPQLVSGQDVATASSRKVINRVAPTYPSIARTLNLSGTVRLEVTVAASGTVKSIKVLGGNPLLAQSAENAVGRWRWEKSDHETSEVVEARFDQQQ